MKKVIFTLLIQILVTISVAHSQGSVLNLHTNGNYLFAVQIDNQYVSAPDRNFTIQNLVPGNHFVRIFRTRYGYNLHEVYNGYVNLPFNSAVNAVYGSGILRIANIVAFAPPAYTYPENHCNNPYPVVNQNIIIPVYDAQFNQILGTLNNINFDIWKP